MATIIFWVHEQQHTPHSGRGFDNLRLAQKYQNEVIDYHKLELVITKVAR